MSYSQLDDSTLMDLVTRSQPDALSELVDRYGNLVFSVAYHVVGDRAAAEEIALDVFVRVWERARLYQGERGSLPTWLASLARHRAIDVLRRRHAHPEHDLPGADDEDTWLEADDPGPEEMAELRIEHERIHAAIITLPAEQRTVLELAYFHGLTHLEISQKLNQPLGTVKTRLRLAMQKLRAALLESDGQPPRPTNPNGSHERNEE